MHIYCKRCDNLLLYRDSTRCLSCENYFLGLYDIMDKSKKYGLDNIWVQWEMDKIGVYISKIDVLNE